MIRLVLIAGIALTAVGCGPDYYRACENVLICQGERPRGTTCTDNAAFESVEDECITCLGTSECKNGRIDCRAVCSCAEDVPYGASVCR